MIMGPLAHNLIRQEFGDLPPAILARPGSLSGYIFCTPGIGSEKLDNYTPLTWRRKLDHWMNQKARAGGAEIITGARVVSLKPHGHGFTVSVDRGGNKQEFDSRFVIGADGSVSVVRSLIFPELGIRHSQVYQEHYLGKVDLDESYFHWFYPVEISPSGFGVHQKDGLVIIDVGGRIGQMKTAMARTKTFLAENYGFDADQKPVWRGSCRQNVLFRELTSRTFQPAKGNALLVGDAGGLIMPVSGEGIGVGIKSALLAAGSILEALKSGKSADTIYLDRIGGIISYFGEIYPWFRRIVDEAKSGGHHLPRLVRDGYASTLTML